MQHPDGLHGRPGAPTSRASGGGGSDPGAGGAAPAAPVAPGARHVHSACGGSRLKSGGPGAGFTLEPGPPANAPVAARDRPCPSVHLLES